MQTPPADSQPRTHFIYPRRHHARIIVLLMVAISAFFTWVASYAAMMLSILYTRKLFNLPETVSALDVTVSLIAAVVPTFLVSAANADALNAYCLRIFHRRRYGRLQRVSQHTDAVRRLPHRLIELTFFLAFRANAKRLKILVHCQPNTVIYCVRRPRKQTRSVRIGFSETPFEPVDLQSDYVDAMRFSEMLSSESPELRRYQEEAESEPISLVDRFKQVARIGSTIVGAIILPLMLYRHSGNWQIFIALAVAAVIGWPILIMSVFRNAPTRWWLVPGGIIVSRRKRLASSQQVGLVTRNQSPLYLTESAFDRDNARTIAHVMTKEGPIKLTGLPEVAGIVLAGWRSMASTPSREEILAFIGPDAVFNE